MKTGLTSRIIGMLALAGVLTAPATAAGADELESAFDSAFTVRPAPSLVMPRAAAPAPSPRAYTSSFEAQIASLASAEQGRIGVAAVDLRTGLSIAVLGDQPFPMASTSKVAIVATFLDGVDHGRFRLSDKFPLMVPLPSRKFDGSTAPVRAGEMLTAETLIELTITRSDNHATDALLAAIGGPQAVNRWLRQAGVGGIRIDRDIATLVRDDGAVDPAKTVDVRDSATPLAMVRLLTGLHQGQWLSPTSRDVLLGAMERCLTGKRRMPAQMPEGVRVAHKTGTLSNTASDVGIIETPDGRAMAVAIYVTGQGGKPGREYRIATIARAIYDGYLSNAPGSRQAASR